MTKVPTSLVDVLRRRAEAQPQRLAYRFLSDGEHHEATITYQELDRRARAIGALLQTAAQPGDRALLLFPPGLDFIAAYFGCLYAKVLAIPLSPPHPARLQKTLPIIQRIMADALPAVALLDASLLEGFMHQQALGGEWRRLKLLVTGQDEAAGWADQWQAPAIAANDLAFLQYTSGSTTTPRGVMVSHGNLLHNLGHLERNFRQSSASHAVIWLPPYHDMGLIGGILQPLYSGYPATLLPHLMFLQRPIRWLEAVTRFRATTSGGPNFAYDLCLRKIKPEQREALDLSSWRVAFNGAEPVSHHTLRQFADYFAPCGFRREAFLPCYGLAEATLLVAGAGKAAAPTVRHLANAGLEQHQVTLCPEAQEDTRPVVSCGPVLSDLTVKIVNPEALQPCPADQVGEIWLSGPSVAAGYWDKPLDNVHTFDARLPASGEGPFLRTGDLGFLYAGELYITGRLKNLIICDGKNYYAHDIEKTVEASHPAIRPGGCAVFALSREGREGIVVIAEAERKLAVPAAEVAKAIRLAVAAQHELPIYDLKLTVPGSIPRTTSGKIRHFHCKTNYMAGALEEITAT